MFEIKTNRLLRRSLRSATRTSCAPKPLKESGHCDYKQCDKEVVTPTRQVQSRNFPFQSYSPMIEMGSRSPPTGSKTSTDEAKPRIDAVASASTNSAEQLVNVDDIPENVVTDSDNSCSTHKRNRAQLNPSTVFLPCIGADTLATMYPLWGNTWIWGRNERGAFVTAPQECYIEGLNDDTNWCMVPFSMTQLVTNVASLEAPALPDGKALVTSSPIYNNIKTYSAGTYNAFQYFRMRATPDLPPYSVTYTGVTGTALTGESAITYYASPTMSMSIGRGLYYYLSNTTTSSNGVFNAYLWVNLSDPNDWIVLGSTASAQVDIAGFMKVPPASVFWSGISLGVYDRWEDFVFLCIPYDVIRVSDSGYGVYSLGDDSDGGLPPTYFINSGTQAGHDIAQYTTANTLLMFLRWLDSVYAGASLNLNVEASFESGFKTFHLRLNEIVGSNPHVASQLNGNNGEWTNGDDMPPKKQKKVEPPKQKKKGVHRQNASKTPPLQRGLMVASNRPKQSVPRGIPLTSSARNFLNACVDPFSSTGRDVFLPIGYSAPSYRVRGFMRVMVSIGTGGVGFVSMVPTVAKDAPCLWYTTSAFTGSAFVPYTDVATPVLSTGVVAASMSTLPFSGSDIMPSNAGEVYSASCVDCTCVAWGMEVMNASTEVNLGGTITAYSDPARNSLYGVTQAQLASYMDAQVVLGTRQRVGLTAYPIEEEETEFSPVVRTRNNGNIMTSSFYPMNWGYGTANCTSNTVPASSNVIIFTGVPGSQYLVNIVGFNEYSGIPTQLVNKAKIVDPQGFSKVMDVLSRARMMCQAQGMRLRDAVGRAEREVAHLLVER